MNEDLQIKPKEMSINIKTLHGISDVFIYYYGEYNIYLLEKYRWNDYESNVILNKSEVDEIIKKRDRIVICERDEVKCYKFDYVRLTSS